MSQETVLLIELVNTYKKALHYCELNLQKTRENIEILEGQIKILEEERLELMKKQMEIEIVDISMEDLD